MEDYFEFYEIPIKFHPDAVLLKRRYMEYSRKYHPDFFVNETIELQEAMLNKSTINNNAYQTLSNFTSRLNYVLKLKQVMQDGESYVLPQDFLLEMMDINEELIDVKIEGDSLKLGLLNEKIDRLEQQLLADIHDKTRAFDVGGRQNEEVLLRDIKDLYYRHKYLSRLRGQQNSKM